jgi:hypothetical protein
MNRALERERRGQRGAILESMRCNVIGNGKQALRQCQETNTRGG